MTLDWYAARPLRGTRLLLTPLRLSDAPDFLRGLGSPTEAAEVTAHLPFRAPDLASVRAVVAAALTDRDRIPYAQRLVAGGELVGSTSFYEIDPARGSIAIGHTWLARPYWRTGLNTESKLLMMGHAFEELEAERLVWHTDIRNLRSQTAIERLGATREGVLRHHRRRPDGSLRDTVQFAMVSAEWPAAKARLLGVGSPHTMTELQLTDNDELSRYEGRLDGVLTTVIAYARRGDVLVVTHTGTEPAFRGRGLAGQATGLFLESVRAEGLRVEPLCPFTAAYFDTHPEVADLRA